MMRRKRIVLIAIILMSVGFASVSATLYLNGKIGFLTNQADFDVYFSKTKENGIENNVVILDKTHISFQTIFNDPNKPYILEYEVTNASTQYDAEIEMNCTKSNDYLTITNKFDTSEPLKARGKRTGKLTLVQNKGVLNEVTLTIICEIKGKALERDTLANGDIVSDEVNYLANSLNFDFSMAEEWVNYAYYQDVFGSVDNFYTQYMSCIESEEAQESETCQNLISLITDEEELKEWMEDYKLEKYIWEDFYWGEEESTDQISIYQISSVTFKDTNEVPASAVKSWDLSNNQNGSIMGWAEPDQELDGYQLYHLFIGQNGGVVANPNSSCLFLYFVNLKEVNGLEYLDTRKVTNMIGMFNFCQNLEILDLSHFDTFNVELMNFMFYGCQSLKELNLTSFNTRNLFDMSYMFVMCSELERIDISHFDTSKVVNMSSLFAYCGKINATISIEKKDYMSYDSIFESAATDANAKIYVVYKDNNLENIEFVENLICSKSEESHVFIKSDFPEYMVSIDSNSGISVSSQNESTNYAYENTTITLVEKNNYWISSFKLNGITMEGITFKMPAENIFITDVVVEEKVIIESNHNPYPNSLDNKVMGKGEFKGATSLTVVLDYQTESTSYDWIYLYDSAGKQYGKYGGKTRKTETITIPGEFVEIRFRTDGSGNNYYGFKATITPNYD